MEKDNSLFLSCEHSQLERNGSWYSRLHMGPFESGSRLHVRTSIRRSLINDLSQTWIIAVAIEGVIHEFSRIPGIHETTIDLLFKFRKVVLNAPTLNNGEMVIVPFISVGSGTLYAKDISWPKGILCRNPEISLATIGPGSLLRGNILIKKTCRKDLSIKVGQPFHFKRSNNYPWLSLGVAIRPVERVGFHIEPIRPSRNNREILIFEILTNGRISPRQALHDSSLHLVHKFRSISNLRYFTFQKKKNLKNEKKKIRKGIYIFKKKHTISLHESKVRAQDFHGISHLKSFDYQNYLSFDLGNIHLTKARYRELRYLGFQTLGQLLERLVFEPKIFSPILKKKRLQSLFRLGFFPF